MKLTDRQRESRASDAAGAVVDALALRGWRIVDDTGREPHERTLDDILSAALLSFVVAEQSAVKLGDVIDDLRRLSSDINGAVADLEELDSEDGP